MNKIPEKLKLLLVDDEEEFLMSSSRALGRRGFEVDVAPNGVTALDKIGRNEYDAIVLDVKMPDIDGVDVFMQIRETHPHLPVLMLTGHSSLDDAFQTARAGIAEYLSKPIDMDELAEKVRKVVAQAGADKQTGIEAKPISETAEPVRVMLIDDEVEFLETMQKVLQRRNMIVMTAESGQQALEMLKENSIDVAVLDLKMPGMDGQEVLRRIKKDYPGVEVIILTGHPSVDSALEVIRLGANEYIKKPPKVEELVMTIRRLYDTRQEVMYKRQQELIDEIRRRYPE